MELVKKFILYPFNQYGVGVFTGSLCTYTIDEIIKKLKNDQTKGLFFDIKKYGIFAIIFLPIIGSYTNSYYLERKIEIKKKFIV